MHDCLTLTQTDHFLNMYLQQQTHINYSNYICIKKQSKAWKNDKNNQVVKWCSYVSFVLCICILLGSIMLSQTCWKSNYLSKPPMQWGGLLSLKDTEINISALEETFPRHGSSKPEPSIHTNVGIYTDIHLNCISRDFHPPGSDKILKRQKTVTGTDFNH